MSCSSIPLVPFCCASCGSVCRPLEPDRARCTNDAGPPRQELWDEDGIRVFPLNESISESWWPKEVKPSPLDVMIVIRVLQEAAQLLGSTVFCICDDYMYKSCFSQLRLSRAVTLKLGLSTLLEKVSSQCPLRLTRSWVSALRWLQTFLNDSLIS